MDNKINFLILGFSVIVISIALLCISIKTSSRIISLEQQVVEIKTHQQMLSSPTEDWVVRSNDQLWLPMSGKR